MSQEQLQLEIGLTIGTQRFLIKVPKNTDLPHLIRNFLKQNTLNPKYQSSILTLVKDKIAQAQQQTIRSLKNIQEKSPLKKAIKTGDSSEEVRNKKEMSSTVNNNNKKEFLNYKTQKADETKDRDISSDSRRLYQQWKQKQKQKNKNRPKKEPMPKKEANLWAPLHKEKHSPDYFYKKGLNFQEECKKKEENNFKKIYPFKTKDMSLSQQQQEELYHRLYSVRQVSRKKDCHKEQGSLILQEKQHKKDPIKQHIKRQDEKIDKQIYRMIKEGSMTFLEKKRSVSKSPFRKTIFH